MTTKIKLVKGGMLLLLLSLTMPLWAASPMYSNNPVGDTIIVKFGKNSKIIIYADNKRDLEKITNYDLNQMLQDLNMGISEMDDSTKVLTIEDPSGNRYLKDTTIVITKVEPDNDAYDWEKDWDKELAKSHKRYTPSTRFNFNIDVGLNNFIENGKFPSGNELYALNPIGSWYWTFGPSFRTHLFGSFFIDLGGNFALNVHRFDNPKTRLDKTATGIVFSEDTRNVSFQKSKLSTWHIQAKAIPMIAFGRKHRDSWRLWNNVDRGFRIGAGPYIGYRIWSRTKYIYKDNGDKKKDKNTGNFLLNDIRYGVRGQIGFGGFDMFVEYDLNKMFQDSAGGPDLQGIRFGITL